MQLVHCTCFLSWIETYGDEGDTQKMSFILHNYLLFRREGVCTRGIPEEAQYLRLFHFRCGSKACMECVL